MRYLLSVILSCFTLVVFAQKTTVYGYVYDDFRDGLPGATVQFLGTGVIQPTTTDSKGYFTLSTESAVDSIRITFLGLKDQIVAVKRGKSQEVKIIMQDANVYEIGGASIDASKNPGRDLMDSVRAHRFDNDVKRVNSYEVKSYVKTRFDLYNLSEKFRNQLLLRRFKYLFDNPDTVNGVPHFPVIIAEINSQIYKKKGGETRERIDGAEISGINDVETLSQLLGSVYNEFNVYDDNQVILTKAFMGPLSPIGESYYTYDLVDSAFIGRHWCYRVKFGPKTDSKTELVYVGEMWIHDTTFAVKSIKLGMNKTANVNLIADFTIDEEFEYVDGQWAMSKEYATLTFDPKDMVNFSLSVTPKNETFRVSVKKTSSFRNYVFNQPPSDFMKKDPADISTEVGAGDRDSTYWQKVRDTSGVDLSESDRAVYSKWDRLKNDPLFKFFYKVGDLIGSGYANLDYFGIGPIYEMYSVNGIEGHRIKIGGRTGDSLSKRMTIEAHLIYGTKDQRFKWDIKGWFFLNKSRNPWRMIGIRARQDIEQLGISAGQWRPDNILGSFLRRRSLSDIAYLDEVSAFIDNDWFTGLNQKLSVTWLRYHDTGTLRFGEKDPNTQQIGNYLNSFTKFEIKLETTFSFGIKYIPGRQKRRPIRGKYPSVKLTYAAGIKGVLGSDYAYHNLRLSITDRVYIKPLGYGDYEISMGKIFGTLAYPLMEIHPGNDTYQMDPSAFNMMNYFEFISDQFVAFRYEHHFEGFFFNKIPLLKNLKWREVLGVRMVAGSISQKNRDYMALPPNTYELRDQRTGKYIPYVEINAGIENIFNLLRVDFLWRLTHRHGPDPNNPGKQVYSQSSNWGIMAGFSIKI